MTVTLNDIAKLVGVSQNTVSRALRGKSDISERTTLRIRQAAEALGYRPNEASRALRSNLFKSVGMLVGGAAGGYYLPQETIQAFSKTLADQGYTCTLVCTGAVDSEHLDKIPLLRARLVDSLVISYTLDIPQAILDAIGRMNLRVIWLNRPRETDALVADEAGAVQLLVQHLAGQGYHSVMYVDYSSGGEGLHNQERLKALDVYGEEYGLRVTRMAHRRVRRSDRYQVTRKWLESPDRPEVAMVSSMTGAHAIVQTALSMGLRVPDDLAVCSFDDGSLYNTGTPFITCAIRPEYQFGVVAAEMALEKAMNPNKALPSRRISFDLVAECSTVRRQGSMLTL